jgi:hypothetical protein
VEWDAAEQGWMLALAAYRLSRCDGCGGDLAETTAHEDWVALPPLRCHKCTAIGAAQDAHDHPHMTALRWAARRRR